LYLFAGFATGLREGRPWNRALPDGQTGTFAAALIFGAAWIIDQTFWSPVFQTGGIGLEALFTPPHLHEMAASAVIVSGPLRAAARRGEKLASPVTLMSTALLLSVLTFATQFIHPLIDPWAAGDYEFRNAVRSAPWLGENIGVASIGGAFAAAYLVEITLLPAGTTWGPSLWAGAIIATTMLTWMMGRVLRAGLPGAVFAPYEALSKEPQPERWTLDPDSSVREQLVRTALDDLGTPEALGRSPLAGLPGVSKGGSASSELRALLVDVIGELAASSAPRDAEAGHLLLDYYVRRVGSHEVIMERLHMSRPTYYRRLHHGYELVANRIDQISVVNRVPVNE